MIGACFGLIKIFVLIPLYFIRVRFLNPKPELQEIKNVGIFHIPAHANGGGEKVLWAIVNKLVEEKKHNVYIYSDKIENKTLMLNKVNMFFGYNLKETDFTLIELESGWLTYAENWKIFSRYLEAFSHSMVAFEALDRFMPDIFIETFTAHFAPITAKFLNPKLKVITYVHYPFTSPTVIKEYVDTTFERGISIKKRVFAALKLVYHYGLFLIYQTMSIFSDTCFANSSWTLDHMDGNWGAGTCQVLYPPCNVEEFWSQKFDDKKRIVVSLGQYRKEKRHDIQLDMMKYHMEQNPTSNVTFRIIGSGKFEESEEIFRGLKKRVEVEKIRNVELLKDLKYQDLVEKIKEGTWGVHTMIDEHLGISVVELLSSGLITLAHNSAGPRDDILGNHTDALYGYLANTDEEFNTTLHKIITDYEVPEERKIMLDRVIAGQNRSKTTFSNQVFSRVFSEKIEELNSEVKRAYKKSQQKKKADKKTSKEGDL